MLTAVLALLLAQNAAPAAPPQPVATPPPKGPFVALDVVQGGEPLGTITVALDREKAPATVDNFHPSVKAGHYDGTTFHRVIRDFMIQGGSMTPEMQERPTRPAIPNEARNGLRNSRGTIAMARLPDPDTATDQFFINLRDNHRLDFGIAGAGYAVFGQVVDGMDVVDRIAATPTTTRGVHQDVPQVSVIIQRAHEVKAAPRHAAPAPTKPAAPGQP
jgi:cyclophilin family peptidyl-prolyl cis-trans isomerase